MCKSCGCINSRKLTANLTNKFDLNVNVMVKNDQLAKKNKSLFLKENLFVVNLISSPGSGKTTLLQAMAQKYRKAMGVIVGDPQTRRDAERIESSGSAAFQIETRGACHLDAGSVNHALTHLDLSQLKLLVIENVGNLVCPAGYYLGETIKIGILSTTEGDDKVLKYPSLFSRISALLINKIDLLPHVDFDVERVAGECKSLNPNLAMFEISAKTGKGLPAFYQYLKNQFT